jgi:hypothetical protein
LWLEKLAASSSRSLAQRVVCRVDRVVHVLFLKECAREECGKLFEHCGCEPGRLYCSAQCSAAARAKSVREARDTYKARGTDEGRAEHASEEAERRRRRSREAQVRGADGSQMPEVVACPPNNEPTAGSREPAPVEAGVGAAAPARLVPETPGVGVAPAAWAVAGGRRVAGPGDPKLSAVGDQRCCGHPHDLQRDSLTAPCAVAETSDAPSLSPLPFAQPAREEREPIEWILVVPPGLLRTARRREGAFAICPFCGRRGRIRHVVSTEQWRRRIRHGFDPLP